MLKNSIFVALFCLGGTQILLGQRLLILNRGEQKIVSVAINGPGGFLPYEISQTIQGGYDLTFDAQSGRLLWSSTANHQILSH